VCWVWLGAPLLVWLMASGLQQNPQGYEAAVFMTRWMFPYIGFMSLVALSAGVLNTWKRFAVPAATPVLLNMAMITCRLVGRPWFKTVGIEPIYAMAGRVGSWWAACCSWGCRFRHSGGWAAAPHSIKPCRPACGLADPGTRRIGKLMLPALLGVSVAQISLLINTQIASHLATGSVSWLTYADRLMEFPTAMLGVALGVVLMPQLAAARAANDAAKYSAFLDWGLRLVVLLSVPSPWLAALCQAHGGRAVPQRGVYSQRRAADHPALMGYGAGLLGLVAIKVLAPGYYASQDIKTPVRIAVAMLVLTQLMNTVLVPLFQVAGLSLSIGLAAMVNAALLLTGLMRRGTFKPEPGWGRFLLQVLVGSALLVGYLLWLGQQFDWIALRSESFKRMALLAVTLGGAVVVYLGSIWAAGLNPRQFLRR
jgi:putative peptidoglycan lipid II flippase